MKKKLVIISESMGGGVRKHVVQLIEYLDPTEFDIYFIHGTSTLDEAFLNAYDKLKEKCTLIPCPSMCREIDYKKDIKSIFFILKVVTNIEPDIIHCHSSKAGVLGRIAAKIKHIDKVFYTPHAYSFLAPEFSEKKKKIFIWIEKILSKYATTTTFNVSIGEKQAALGVKLDNENKFKVVYNGIPNIQLPQKNDVKRSWKLTPKDIVVGTNARFSEQKNPMLFLNIARKVITDNPQIHFVWCGDGPLYEEAEKFILENSLKNNIHLLGDRQDSELLVAGYDIFISTSLYEGLPYAPIEAKRAGIPIIATNVTGNNEIVDNFKTGILFDKESIQQAYKYINSIINNEMVIKKVDILDEYKSKFSLETMINSIQKIYLD